MAMAIAEQPPATRRFTADEVWRMLEVGLLAEDEPYELIDGELQYVIPPGPPHAQTVNRLTMTFAAVYAPLGCVVRVQQPVVGIVDAIPEPDIAVVTADVESAPTHPTPEQTLLMIEVAYSSHRRDRRKGEIYARAGAPEYWIVDIPGKVVTVFRRPRPDGTWGERIDVGADGEIPLAGSDRSITTRAIFGG